jgi:FkbM family methyltransferase
MIKWEWYQNPKTKHWYRTRKDDWLLYNRIGQDGGRGYQVQLQDYVRHFFQNKTASMAIDVGANMGITAIEYAHIFKTVIAFEPIKDVFDQLQMVIQKNNLSNVKCEQVAIGDTIGRRNFSYRPNNSFASALNDTGIEACRMNTIDSYNYQDVNFLKIDVEGLEAAVIAGAWNTITKFKPMIQFEYKKNLGKKYGYDLDKDICQKLMAIDYHIVDKKNIDYKESKQLDLFAIPPK